MLDKVIVIVGPTASGKSDLAIEVAKKFNGEIISGDAYQVYKGMKIGTAQVSDEEMQGIRHHLVNELEIDDEYNVKIFQEKGRKLISDIIAKGKTPIICGGTGLYIKALLYDYVFEEENDNNKYIEELEKLTNEQLYNKLKLVDPKSLETIHENNRKRLIRALVIASNGKTKSDNIGNQKQELLYDAHIICTTVERSLLHERINSRVDRMFEAGLVEEVTKLNEIPNVFELQSFQGIGYKEFIPYFLGNLELEDVKEQIKINTRQFAKRQISWFKNQMRVKWFDVFNDDKEELFKYINNFLK